MYRRLLVGDSAISYWKRRKNAVFNASTVYMMQLFTTVMDLGASKHFGARACACTNVRRRQISEFNLHNLMFMKCRGYTKNKMSSALLWDFTRRRMLIPCRRFGTIYQSHFQGSSNSRRLIAACSFRTKYVALS